MVINSSVACALLLTAIQHTVARRGKKHKCPAMEECGLLRRHKKGHFDMHHNKAEFIQSTMLSQSQNHKHHILTLIHCRALNVKCPPLAREFEHLVLS